MVQLVVEQLELGVEERLEEVEVQLVLEQREEAVEWQLAVE